MRKKRLKIAVIGYGRFGKLLTQFLLPFGEINVISKQKIKDKQILKLKYAELANMDWIIPAVPISEFENVLKKIRPYLKSGSLVMDICSVKVLPCKLLKKYIPQNCQILGTHPMFGPDSAKNGLNGLQIVICPLRISKETLNQVVGVFRKLKLKIIETSPGNHDKQAARCLGLVHLIGRALLDMKIKEQPINTLGFKRLLAVNETVKNDSWQLFFDMQRFNPYASKTRSEFINSLKSLNEKIKIN